MLLLSVVVHSALLVGSDRALLPHRRGAYGSSLDMSRRSPILWASLRGIHMHQTDKG